METKQEKILQHFDTDLNSDQSLTSVRIKSPINKRRFGILFVHGIVSNTSIFDFLSPLIPDDVEVQCLTLDGHGGDALAFSRTSMKKWKSQVRQAVDDMLSRCDKVIGVGHSMGCLLLLEQVQRGCLAGLFLLKPPLRLRLRKRMFTNAYKVVRNKCAGDDDALAAQESYGVAIDYKLWHYYGWPGRFIELFAEIYRVRTEILPEVKCPVYAFIGGKDEMVSKTSARCFDTVPDAKVVIMPHSGHFNYPKADNAVMQEHFRAFIAKIFSE